MANLKTITSRRAVLAGIAAVPALAAPALALPDASADAELIELGRELDPIIEEWQAKRAIDRVRQDAFEAKVREATGIAFKDAPEIPGPHPWPTGSCWDIRDRIVMDPDRECDPVDEDGVSLIWGSSHDRMYDLIDEILELEAKTIPGLAVQARAITLSEFQLWDDEEDDDPIRKFIELVCAFVGVTPVPLTLDEAAS
jgi:hypothetical protein